MNCLKLEQHFTRVPVQELPPLDLRWDPLPVFGGCRGVGSGFWDELNELPQGGNSLDILAGSANCAASPFRISGKIHSSDQTSYEEFPWDRVSRHFEHQGTLKFGQQIQMLFG